MKMTVHLGQPQPRIELFNDDGTPAEFTVHEAMPRRGPGHVYVLEREPPPGWQHIGIIETKGLSVTFRDPTREECASWALNRTLS